MSGLVEAARAAHNERLAERRRVDREDEERRRQAYAQARREALDRAYAVVDRVLGRHDGLDLYCLLGGMSDLGEIHHLSSVEGVRTVVFKIDGTDRLLAVYLERRVLRMISAPTGDGPAKWVVGRQVQGLADLGEILTALVAGEAVAG